MEFMCCGVAGGGEEEIGIRIWDGANECPTVQAPVELRWPEQAVEKNILKG